MPGTSSRRPFFQGDNFINANHQFSGNTPLKTNGWNLKIACVEMEIHDFGFKMLVFAGEYF